MVLLEYDIFFQQNKNINFHLSNTNNNTVFSNVINKLNKL